MRKKNKQTQEDLLWGLHALKSTVDKIQIKSFLAQGKCHLVFLSSFCIHFFRDYFSLALLLPLFPHRQHQENNKQYEICETTSRSDAPYLIISIISLGRHAISQDPINKVAAAACELGQCVNKSHFSSELYMNSCWSHSEFGELINGRIGLKRLMKKEEKYCRSKYHCHEE